MSLGIAFKGPEGIVLAADSRVTLTAQQKAPDGSITFLPSTFDNATKLLRVEGCSNVGVVTYGLGALGSARPRTAHSYISEFEQHLKDNKKNQKGYSTEEFAHELSAFFEKRWGENDMPLPDKYNGPPMTFLIAGYDEGEPYGRVFQIQLPFELKPKEWHEKGFGVVWGGQQDIVTRLLNGYDPLVLPMVGNFFGKTQDEINKFKETLDPQVMMRIPYMFLPLQDCIDLSILLIETTRVLQSYSIGVRGVGGEIDVATITKSGGFKPYKEKAVAKLYRKDAEI